MTDEQENLYMVAQNIAYLTSAIDAISQVLSNDIASKSEINNIRTDMYNIREKYFKYLNDCERKTKQTDENKEK